MNVHLFFKSFIKVIIVIGTLVVLSLTYQYWFEYSEVWLLPLLWGGIFPFVLFKFAKISKENLQIFALLYFLTVSFSTVFLPDSARQNMCSGFICTGFKPIHFSFIFLLEFHCIYWLMAKAVIKNVDTSQDLNSDSKDDSVE